MAGNAPLDFDAIFSHPRLHLLAWDRQDPAAHATGLQLPARIEGDPRLKTLVVPLLRPSRRNDSNRLAIQQAAAEYAGSPIAWSCELWLQVANAVESGLWSLLQVAVGSHASGIAALRSLYDAGRERWQPLGDDACSSYVLGSGPAPGSSEDAVYHSLPCEARASVLKGIWWRGTRQLLEAFALRGGTYTIDAHTQRAEMASILARVLDPFDLREFGSAMPRHRVDPSRFGVSHLSCSALNAFMAMDLDQAYGDHRATRPYYCATLGDYLAGIRTGSW